TLPANRHSSIRRSAVPQSSIRRSAIGNRQSTMVDDAHYMRKAIALAERERGRTSPNPMVDALVVDDACRFGECRLKRNGLGIDEWRLDRGLTVDAAGQSSLINPSIGSPSIINPSIGHRQSAIDN